MVGWAKSAGSAANRHTSGVDGVGNCVTHCTDLRQSLFARTFLVVMTSIDNLPGQLLHRFGTRGGLVVLALMSLTVVSRATPVYESDLPDFYQHQLSGSDPSAPFNRPGSFSGYSDPSVPSYSTLQPYNDGGPGIQWERNGGWCHITAFTDVFYQLDKNGASGLFDHGGDYTWLERMNYAISDFAIKAWGFGGVQKESVRQFIDGTIGNNRVTMNSFSWDSSLLRVLCNGEATSFTSMYSLYSYQLAIGNSAVLNLVNPGTANPDWWWSSSYHMVAAAGYDNESSDVYYADPNGNGSDPTLENWGHPYGLNDALPIGASYYNSNTMDETGLLSGTGEFSGALVNYIYVLSVVPEPSTYALFGIGAIGMLMVMRRRKAV